MADLIKYDAACRAVSEAASIDEAMEFRDKSEAMRAYARQAKNKQLEVQAAEIRIRAERRIGELMSAQREAGAMSSGGRPSEKTGSRTDPVSAPPTLEEVGINKHLADRARKYAAIPEGEFNGIVDEWKERVEQENERVTVNLLAASKKAEGQAKAPAINSQSDDENQRLEIGKLTPDAMIDEIVGLQAALEEERAKRVAAEARITELEGWWRTTIEGSNVGRALGAAEAQLRTLQGRLSEYMQIAKREEYKRKKAEARVAELERMEIAL